ncbi:MAG: response regulator [Actinomycetota bacterium]|nr:response regulator [Actinomycetota bacterium]
MSGPVVGADVDPPPEGAAKLALRAVDGQVVLIAEDDASVRMTLAFVLEDEGFQILVAPDGEAALRIASTELPDVILLDRIMPKMDGKQVFLALRRGERTRDIPVLVLSGMERDWDGDWEGAEFVGKPFAPEDLIARIRRVLGSRG